MRPIPGAITSSLITPESNYYKEVFCRLQDKKLITKVSLASRTVHILGNFSNIY